MENEVVFVNIDTEQTISESELRNRTKKRKQVQQNSCEEENKKHKQLDCKEEKPKFAHIPSNSGYFTTHNDTTSKSSESWIQKESSLEMTPSDTRRRMMAWSYLDTCPKCGSQDLFKYMDGSLNRYYVQCSNIANSIYKEIDCLCRGMIYEVPVRMKNSGEIPLSHQVKSLEEYVEKVQDRICGWHVSM